MGTDTAQQAELRRIIDVALRAELDEELATRVCEMGPEATRAVMLAVNARLAELAGKSGPHTPSGSIPPYAKPSAPKRRRTPGARDGHEGHRPRPHRLRRDRNSAPHALRRGRWLKSYQDSLPVLFARPATAPQPGRITWCPNSRTQGASKNALIIHSAFAGF